MAMPYLSHVRWHCRRVRNRLPERYIPRRFVGALMLSPNGKKASLPSATLVFFAIHAFFFFHGQHFGLLGEEHFPSSVAQHVVVVFTDIDVDGVVAVGTANAWLKRQCHNFWFWRNHQMSALLPARRVQWMRLCWPAPMPMVWPSFT